MKVRPLNRNEIYCCTPKSLKNLFREEDITIRFGEGISRNEEKNNRKYRPNKKCNDRILAFMVVRKSRLNRFGFMNSSYLRIFILNAEQQNFDLCERFESETLPILYRLYLAHKNDDDLANDGAFCVTVGLNGDKINIYEDKVKSLP